MNCSTEPVSCHICGKCGCLMDKETANIVDNLPDLEKNIPEYVLMPLVYSWIRRKNDKAIDGAHSLCTKIWSIFPRN